MHRSHDRNDLEQRTDEAHGLYIEALILLERLRAAVESGAPDVTPTDVIQADCLLAERRYVLVELLNELGYMPEGFTAKLLRRRKGVRWPDATADSDLATLRRTYLDWRGNAGMVAAGVSPRSMTNLGKILTILGLISEEDEMTGGLGGASAVH